MKQKLALNTAAGLSLLGLAAAFGALLKVPPTYALLSLSVLTVTMIVFGDDLERRFVGEGAASERNWLRSVVDALHSREVLLPCFLIAGLWLAGYMRGETIGTVISEKIDILFLILTFAVIAQGFKHSGYFKYSAYRVLEICDGKVTRVTLYLFCLCSVLTFVTSNDIVILVMTPIVLELVRQARIRNARLLLISQFIAANTLSMGLLIGSPTNIIVASEVGLNFFEYFMLMLAPSVLAAVAGLLALHLINVCANRCVKHWQYSELYYMPALKEQLDFTKEMRNWIGGFVSLLVGVSIVSHFQLSFFWITIPAMAVALVALSRLGERENDRAAPLKQCLGSLPYQIFFFAIAFFAISEALAEHLPSERILGFVTERGLWWNSFSSMLGTGLLVNTINDLPAAAMTAKILEESSALGALDSRVMTQSVLAALNIGCYVTPIGALAGIIWFHIMRSDGGGGGETWKHQRNWEWWLMGCCTSCSSWQPFPS